MDALVTVGCIILSAILLALVIRGQRGDLLKQTKRLPDGKKEQEISELNEVFSNNPLNWWLDHWK